MTDGQLVKIARQLQRMRDRAHALLSKLDDAGHDSAATDLRVQCFGEAWPEHVIENYLSKPDNWECDATGIRRKGRK